ncbi:hypothetical protein GCM10022381_41670 [Leifsonia kafniensis]|uniref:Pilus assembly protein PilO n=1 Tax=Leifsonia kafniensis TaxID=475957 RepID=A0ABP7L851_9MICO
MDKNRLWIIASVLGIVAVLALGWVLGIQPQLSAAAQATVDRLAVEQTNVVQATALAKLKKDFESIDALKAELAPLSASVPTGTEAPAFVSQVDALAIAQGVTLLGLTMDDPLAYVPVEAPDAVVPADAAATDATAADSAAAAEPAAAAPAPAPIAAGVPPVTNAQITSSNFASLAVSIDVSGSYANVLNFVSGLQSGARLVMVTGLKTAAVTDAPGEVTATVSGLIYSLVSADAAPAAG